MQCFSMLFFVAIAFYMYGTMLQQYKSETQCEVSEQHVMTSFNIIT
jgi:hypothetical protein